MRGVGGEILNFLRMFWDKTTHMKVWYNTEKRSICISVPKQTAQKSPSASVRCMCMNITHQKMDLASVHQAVNSYFQHVLCISVWSLWITIQKCQCTALYTNIYQQTDLTKNELEKWWKPIFIQSTETFKINGKWPNTCTVGQTMQVISSFRLEKSNIAWCQWKTKIFWQLTIKHEWYKNSNFAGMRILPMIEIHHECIYILNRNEMFLKPKKKKT